MEFTKLLVIIPTRNRAELAVNAVRSVLSREEGAFEVIVSDNSTEESEAAELKKFCENLRDERLTYLRPPEPLSMPKHWEWAKDQGLQNHEISHVCYLTDRMVFRRNAVSELIDAAGRFPDQVICYNADSVNDLQLPVVLRQLPWTGKLLEVSSDAVIKMSAGSVWHYSTPRMLNAVVPKTVFHKISQKYGIVFESISPDLCFLYKCLGTETDYLLLDKSLIIEYGMKRSNGNNAGKGIAVKDTSAFFKDIAKDGMTLNQDTPVPQFGTIINAVINEYCFIRKQTADSKFPALDMPAYFRANYQQFQYIEDESLKAKMEKIFDESISEYNLSRDRILAKTSVGSRLRKISPEKIVAASLLKLESKMFDKSRMPFRVTPKRTEHQSVSAAMDYANEKLIARRIGLSDLEYLLDVKLPKKSNDSVRPKK